MACFGAQNKAFVDYVSFFGHESHDINITIQAPFFKIIRKAAKSFFVSFSVYILDIWIGSIFLTWVGSDPGIQDCQEVRLPNTWTHATRLCFTTKMASCSDGIDELSDVELDEEVMETVSGPARAEITRERSVRSTGGKYGKRGKSDVKKVSLHDRIAQFPNQNLAIRESPQRKAFWETMLFR